jgi:hypothetical protein
VTGNQIEEQIQPLLRAESCIERRISFFGFSEAGEYPNLVLHSDEFILDVSDRASWFCGSSVASDNVPIKPGRAAVLRIPLVKGIHYA